MFGRPKPVIFDPYGSRPARRWIPRWLWLLVFGAAVGAGALYYAQQQLLPPRLSAEETTQLRAALDSGEQEHARVAAELEQTRLKLDKALAEQARLASELATSHRDLEMQRKDIEGLLAALPLDPRGGAIEIRAANFQVDRDTLGYDIVFSRGEAQGPPFAGVLQLFVAGTTAGGTETTIELKPAKVEVGHYAIAHGGLPIPAGFVPRQVTIRVLDRAGGKRLGMRVINIG